MSVVTFSDEIWLSNLISLSIADSYGDFECFEMSSWFSNGVQLCKFDLCDWNADELTIKIYIEIVDEIE